MDEFDKILGGMMQDAAGVPKPPKPPEKKIEPYLDVQKTAEDRIQDIVSLSGVSREDLEELFGGSSKPTTSTTIIETAPEQPAPPPIPAPPPVNVAPMQLPPAAPAPMGAPAPVPGMPPRPF